MVNFRIYRSSRLTDSYGVVECGVIDRSVIPISIERVTLTNVRDSEDQIVFKALGVCKVVGLNIDNVNESLQGNDFPLNSFQKKAITEGDTGWNAFIANPQHFYTEGLARFNVLYGGRDGYTYIGIGNPFVYTNGTGADPDGYQSTPIYTEYGGYNGVINGSSNYSFIPMSINDSEYRDIRIRFFMMQVVEDAEPYDCIIAVISAVNIQSGNEELLLANRINGFSYNIINGIEIHPTGYEPTTGNVNRGGTGNGIYPYDEAEGINVNARNAAFGFSSQDGKGLCYYKTTNASVREMLWSIYNDSYVNIENRIAALIDCFVIPVATTVTNISTVYVADLKKTVSYAGFLTERFKEVSFRIADLTNAGWDDFNDFSNTKATLTLPFIGRVNIDMNSIARGYLEVKALVDMYNGNIAYWVYTRSMQAPTKILYNVYEGSCAVQVPLGGVYQSDRLGKCITYAAGMGAMAVGVAMENPKIAVGGALSTLKVGHDAFEYNVDKSHTLTSTSAATTSYQVRLDIERREMMRTDKYVPFAAIPAFTTKKLGELSGFVVIHSADYDGLKCEQAEKEVIKSMLEEGVYL